ncbi:uncharacterized protein [Solanum tuberosum]|uniref:uncharacterized protein isoform X1 n=1 Tax=Solanum tuberosum TaxID=4113 RepID=UPI00073A12FE|nr:PREDICTED: uncharacterized protein LOC107063231 isoform X1 [Solanum tuberosum]
MVSVYHLSSVASTCEWSGSMFQLDCTRCLVNRKFVNLKGRGGKELMVIELYLRLVNKHCCSLDSDLTVYPSNFAGGPFSARILPRPLIRCSCSRLHSGEVAPAHFRLSRCP